MNEMLDFILKDSENLAKFLKTKLEEIQWMPFVEKDELPDKAGIYVFYDDEKPIYVGRTDNIRQRIQFHTRPSSGSESATFAFILAKDIYKNKNKDDKKMTRKELEANEKFQKIFTEQKEYLNESKIRFRYLLIENDILQTILEPYIAYNLKTYPTPNTFENH